MPSRRIIILGAVGAAALILAFALFSGGGDEERAERQIRIVGSSTVFPFAAAVAERFGQSAGSATPIVESTGTGGGFKLFCGGIGARYPDISNASRRIKESEYRACRDKGIAITEVKIGFDGIVLANARRGPSFALTRKQIFLALAKQVPQNGRLVPNPYRRWNEIDPSLPAIKIEALGPPPTSGTRDAFVEIAMEGGAKEFPTLRQLREKDKKAFKAAAHAMREDGAFVEAGENDNLIVQKLLANEALIGIFGFSFLNNNRDRLKGAAIEGVQPDFANIADGDYKVSRSLFFYVKKNHVGVVPGIEGYVREFTKDATWGPKGYLARKGLIPLPEAARKRVGAEARALAPLDL